MFGSQNGGRIFYGRVAYNNGRPTVKDLHSQHFVSHLNEKKL